MPGREGTGRNHLFQRPSQSQICGSVNVRAQISRHRGWLMCVALSHADMHSGIFLPVAPPEEDAVEAVLEDVAAPGAVVVPGAVVLAVPMAPLVPVPNAGALVLVAGSV